MTVVAGIPFNPLHPLLGIDPAFVMGAGTLLASVIGYQMGAAAGQVLWRAVDRERARDMDVVYWMMGCAVLMHVFV